MKNFKSWLSKKLEYSKTRTFLPIANRIKLEKTFYSLSDERFLNVKIADEHDVDSILEIQRLCYNGHTPWDRIAVLHEIRYNKNAFYIILHEDNQPIAFVGAWFVASEAHITNIATIPNYERKGLGTYLLKEIIHSALEENMSKVTLEVRVSNHVAQSLYTTLGFQKGRLKKEYYAKDHEDALEMIYIL
ncbi:MAG: ribosomal protein S18-alanine N-acetyltransferase [Alkalibacterium gilvum]|uniref:Ribosomal-protein-alanine N-acetyltransferase n=1 Tax=Alkalibacterium gilvum TaxID=1130080 RepID=A0A1H6V470_9LACT|nr:MULTISPECIES: ribosomal protein S18-alanine N-acetyltransferase [Alkalibacterium]MDN6294035.1 ribosomal protein S18-alanine N-acetyltransferase [Alkalibacterium sp.]MDN6295453.1 ribosomal protein S18-alanine N-acetyltransferase [Alkalibacterium sp.]SEI95035.1 ribosomal-protein-alanine N-acetyltransferase [Alkalibacterium gilvum]